jgi:hypothetical protein
MGSQASQGFHGDFASLLQAHYEILPKKVETPKHKEESLLYDKGQVIDLDGSPIGYFFMLYAKAFEKAVYVGATLLLDEREALLNTSKMAYGRDCQLEVSPEKYEFTGVVRRSRGSH